MLDLYFLHSAVILTAFLGLVDEHPIRNLLEQFPRQQCRERVEIHHSTYYFLKSFRIGFDTLLSLAYLHRPSFKSTSVPLSNQTLWGSP
jgi:hypothetical protein